jgi:hypothetical protein
MPAEKRKQVKELADKQGMSVPSFVRSVLYREIKQAVKLLT